MRTINNLNISAIKIHPRNQEFFDDIDGENYERFKKSIQDEGIITPLIVAPDMTLISGHQRLKAIQDLGIHTIPVVIDEDISDDNEKLKKLLAANFGRLKNNPIKQGKVIQEYEKLAGVKHGGARPNCSVLIRQEDIAKQFGLSVDSLQNYKKLLNLIPEFQQLIESDTLSPTIGYKVLAKLSKEDQDKLIEELGKDKLADMTQKQLQQYIDDKNKVLKEKEELEKSNKELREKLTKSAQEVQNKIESELRKKEERLKQELEDENKELIEDLELEIKNLKSSLNDIKTKKEKVELDKNDYATKYSETLKQLADEMDKVSYFMSNDQNFQLTKQATEYIDKMKNFIKEMTDVGFFADIDALPNGTRQEYIRGIYGIYKWSRTVLNDIDLNNVAGINTNIIDITNTEEIIYE